MVGEKKTEDFDEFVATAVRHGSREFSIKIKYDEGIGERHHFYLVMEATGANERPIQLKENVTFIINDDARVINDHYEFAHEEAYRRLSNLQNTLPRVIEPKFRLFDDRGTELDLIPPAHYII